MSDLVIYRDFGDSDEIGILSEDGWVDVGDFDYYLPDAYQLHSIVPFIILGYL